MNDFLYFGIDSLYYYLVVPAIILVLFSQLRVKRAFSKYSAFRSGLTGAEAARVVLNAAGVTGVKIERVKGSLTDHYDPRTNVIRLSETVYDASNLAAVGVAAHEAGHAVQYAGGYFAIKLRAVILPVCNLGSQLSLPLIIVGILFNFNPIIRLGIIFFCAALVFQLLTLPIEFNASKRALSLVEGAGILTDGNDKKAIKSVLSAAAMTYIAALLVSVTQLVRLIAISKRRR